LTAANIADGSATFSAEIHNQDFDFPQFGKPDSANRFVLSGSLKVGLIPPPPPPPCAALRAAVQEKRDQIQALNSRLVFLQKQLQTATPQAKPAIIKQIQEVGASISQAEEQLRLRAFALKQCETGVLDPTDADS
jgi:hypothetical protein